MKHYFFKNHTIIKSPTDLGEDDESLNYVYQIYTKDGKYLASALTLSSAKDYIASGCNENYL